MHPIDHHRKLFEALTNPLLRSSDELWTPADRRPDPEEFWPLPEQERRSDEQLWREKV